MLRSLAGTFIDFLFPKEELVYKLEKLGSGELLKLLEPARPVSEECIAIFNYADPQVRTIIWELKYRKNQEIAKTLASILFEILEHELAERALFENFVHPLLIPIPMSPKRLRERGYNQTEILCEEIVKLDVSNLLAYTPHHLIKLTHTESQARTKLKHERLQNISGSMKVSDHESVRGRNVVLIDDVTTTGATLKEAKRVLKEAGTKKILCLALAH